MPSDRPLDVTRPDAELAAEAARLAERFHGRGAGDPLDSTTPRTQGTTPPDPGDRVPPELPDNALAEGGRWSFQRLLGGGGGGEVFAFEDGLLGRPVAVKVLPAAVSAQPERARHFIDEARTAAALEHPSVLPVHDLGRAADGRLWFAMRQASGRSLAAIISDLAAGHSAERLEPLNERVGLIVRVCDAIAFAHARGYLHCDIKPGNIMVGDYGEVLVVDWGSAVRLGGGGIGGGGGTPLYMAPEQARHGSAVASWDIYGLGATLWHLVLLRPPLHDVAPERFWERKRQGEFDPPTEVERAAVPASLLAVMERAVHADPAARQASIEALRDELRAWLRHRDAEAVVATAERHLDELKRHGDYEAFQRIENDLQRVLAESPALVAARQALARVRGSKARLAIRRGDLALAEGLLDAAEPQHRSVLRDLLAARRTQRVQRRLGWTASVLAMLAFVVLAAWIWREHRASFGLWQTVWQHDFTTTEAAQGLTTGSWDADLNLSARQRLPVAAQAGGLILGAQQLLHLPVEVPGSVRVTVDATWTAGLDACEIIVNASPEHPDRSFLYPPGIVAQFAGYRGHRTLIAVQRQPGMLQSSEETHVPFERGRRYRLELAVEDGRCILAVDGRQVLAYQDARRLGDDAYRHIHLRAWQPGLRLENLRVERLGDPRRASPLRYADGLLDAGRSEQAATAYLQLADDHPGTALEADALLGACVALQGSVRLPDLLQRLERGHPGNPRLAAMWELDAIAAIDGDDLPRALQRLTQIHSSDPASRAPLRLLGHAAYRTEPEATRAMVQAATRIEGRFVLDLRGHRLGSLEPLRGAPLIELHAEGCGSGDLLPLSGMPLRELSVAATVVRDLSPLSGMPLERLQLTETEVADLRSLAGMTSLSDLSLAQTRVSSLSPLTGLSLQTIDISRTAVGDLRPLAGMPLWRLQADNTPVADLTPLGTTHLHTLELDGSAVATLAPLAGGKLRRLVINRTRISDLTPLRGHPLEELDATDTPIADLSPLAASVLREVRLDRSQVRDLSALASGRLRKLGIAGTPVTDLAALAGQPLFDLDISDTAGLDLRPVVTSLVQLRAQDARLDLEPLRGSRIVRLDLRGARVSSFAPLLGMPQLRQVFLHGAVAVDGGTLEELADGLRRRGAEGPAEAALIAALVGRGDWTGLRRLATYADGRLILDLRHRMTWDSARALAARAGGHLPHASAALRLLIDRPDSDTFWLGAAHDAEVGWRWDDGTSPSKADARAFALVSRRADRLLANRGLLAGFYAGFSSAEPYGDGESGVILTWAADGNRERP
ncbi:MAG TPA: hypothetical protein DCS97_09025 [Planctomycetes bacterium]|nr:hypothetical protein [Planctomycetota bacterium]